MSQKRSQKDREQRIRELIDLILADTPPREAELLRLLLSDPDQAYQVVGTLDPKLEPLLGELTALRAQEDSK